MDQNEKNKGTNPKEGANLLSQLGFLWLRKLFLAGWSRDLQESDICSPLKEHKSSILGDFVDKCWKKKQEEIRNQGKNTKPNLFKILFKCVGVRFLIAGGVEAFDQFFLSIIQPILLANLMSYFSPKQQIERSEALLSAGFLIFSIIVVHILAHHMMFWFLRIGINMNVACSSLIYRKVLRLSPTAMGEHTTSGQMVNLMSHDTNRFDYVAIDAHYLWIVPVQVLIISCIIYQYAGWTALVGMFVVVLFFPLLACFGKVSSYMIPKQVYKTDNRLRLMNEIIRAIQIIKMYAWEKPFCSLVEKSRTKETNEIRRINILYHISFSLQLFVPKICLFISIASYTYFGNTITADKVYLFTTFYNILQRSMFSAFPLGVQSLVSAIVSARRITDFLCLDELPQTSQEIHQNGKQKESSNLTKDLAICFEKAYAKWSSNTEEDTLRNINFSIERGSLVAVIGEIGAGKTSLLQALLRELPLESGSMTVKGKISYACQESWIFASSIRQNILFGNQMDKERYDKIIEVCQLKRDLSLFPYGDKTTVGDRGISLSGGQKARISLARAVYSEADIYLFDDPLSAVDTEVGRRIFSECFKSFLKDKTIVLVTHQIQYLRFVDRVLVLDEGKVLVEGTYEQLQNSNVDVAKHVQIEHADEDATLYDKRDDENESYEVPIVNEYPEDKETRFYGKITMATYIGYFKAVDSWVLVALMLALLCFCKVTNQGSDYFVAYWVNNVEIAKNDTVVSLKTNWYLTWYATLIISNVFAYVLVILIFHQVCIRASKNLHNRMFQSVCQAAMRFFNINPTGRIVNRFSRDVELVDIELPFSLFDVMDIGLIFIITITIIVMINPWLAISAALMIVVIGLMRMFYIHTSRNIKRLEGITRSPMFNHLTETVHGLTTIRAFHAQNNLIKQFDAHQDFHTSAWFLFVSCSRAFGMYVDVICSLHVAATILLFFFLDDVALPGDVGLVITQSMLLCGMVQWGTRQLAEVENQMTSVERILEYTNLEEEPAFESNPENRPPSNWPSQGRIEFKDMCLTYSPDSEPVLKNVNLVIMPQEKIGIVGRSGAGKSSLIAALFRLAYMKGEIYIDNIAISNMGIHSLRPKITIIPQEPVLFAGSLRKNLDPFDEYSDNSLWQALENVEMKEFVESMAGGLYTKISEGGKNYSSGQRQLLCLARTIIKKNKILILDEATANVDLQTDELIQRTVRKNFQYCTVLTVAHRLNTIMDSDRVLVVDAGKIVEFDHPHVLLQDEKSFFRKLVHQTGPATARKLSAIAEKTYRAKKDT